MDKKLIKYMIVVTVIILFVISVTVAVVAAFVSRGRYKDIITGGEYYFESNVLKSGDNNIYTCYTKSLNITVLNSNVNGVFNTVPITYDIKFSFQATPGVTYKITDGTTEHTVTGTGDIFYNGKILQGGVKVIHEYTLTVEGENAPSPVDVIATPTAPQHMTSRIISSTIQFGVSEFSATGTFDISPAVTLVGETTSSNELAHYSGFIYRITTSGAHKVGDTITVTWDATKLDYSAYNKKQPPISDPDGIHKHITFSPDDNILALTFFRVPGAFDATTIDALNDLVSVTVTLAP